MEILICATNLAVLSCVSLIKENENKSFLLITDQPNIEQFFSFIQLPNVIVEKVENSNTGIFDIICLTQQKKQIKAKLRQLSIEKISFFHQAYGGILNWIIWYCHQSLGVKVVMHRVLNNLIYQKAPWTYRTIGMLTKQYLQYGFTPEIQIIGKERLFPKLSKDFFRKNDVSIIPYEPSKQVIDEISTFIVQKLKIRENKETIVLLTGSAIEAGIVECEEYTNKITNLITTLGKERLVCKCHPRFKDEIPVEQELPHIPSFIPMEFLEYKFHTYIGNHSTVLKQCSEKNCLSISLLKYFKMEDRVQQQRYISYLSGASVKFPETIEEIVGLLKNIQN